MIFIVQSCPVKATHSKAKKTTVARRSTGTPAADKPVKPDVFRHLPIEVLELITKHMNRYDIEELIAASYWAFKKMRALGYSPNSTIGSLEELLGPDEFQLPLPNGD